MILCSEYQLHYKLRNYLILVFINYVSFKIVGVYLPYRYNCGDIPLKHKHVNQKWGEIITFARLRDFTLYITCTIFSLEKVK